MPSTSSVFRNRRGSATSAAPDRWASSRSDAWDSSDIGYVSWAWPFPTSISRIGDPASSDSASAHGPSTMAPWTSRSNMRTASRSSPPTMPDTSLPSGSTTTSRPVSGSNRDPARASAPYLRMVATSPRSSSSTNARSPAMPSGVTVARSLLIRPSDLMGER